MSCFGWKENEMNEWFQIDERAEQVGDRLAFIFLGLTHIALYIAMMFQRYVQGLETAYYNDVTIILIVSLLGYWGARFYLGGILPALSTRQVLLIYLFLVASIAIPHTLVHGWPKAGEWLGRLMPMLGGPALLVGGYALLAYLGKKRLEGLISSAQK
jgi:hypothetical protein